MGYYRRDKNVTPLEACPVGVMANTVQVKCFSTVPCCDCPYLEVFPKPTRVVLLRSGMGECRI